jgi:hypothetical protein
MTSTTKNETAQTFNPAASTQSQDKSIQAAPASTTQTPKQPAFNSQDHRHYAMCG